MITPRGLTTLGLVFVLIISFLAPSVSSAATLTIGQVNAIIGLLRAFGVGQTEILNVQHILDASPSITSSASTTSLQASPIATIDQSSLLASSGTITLSGSAQNMDSEYILVRISSGTNFKGTWSFAQIGLVQNGRWSVTFNGFGNTTNTPYYYPITVSGPAPTPSSLATAPPIATGTLTLSAQQMF